MRISDWSSDVCSSDLTQIGRQVGGDPVDCVLGFYERVGEILLQQELDRDRHAAVGDRGSQMLDPGDARQRILDAPRDLGFKLSRCGPRERSEEHTSELQSLMRTPYAVFCVKKKKQTNAPNQMQ